MANKDVCVISEDRFDLFERKLTRGTKEAVRYAGESVLGASKQNVIEMDVILTGDLYRSGGLDYGPDGESVSVNYTVPYASFQHDGTDKIEGRPFLGLALDQQKDQIDAFVERTLERDYE